MTEVALVFAGDEAFVEGLAVALHSAVRHLSPAVPTGVFVLDNGLSATSLLRLDRVCARANPEHRLQVVAVPSDRVAGLPTRPGMSSTAYSRILIPDLLPPTTCRVVYLDADVLVRGDLRHLLELDLAGAPLAAAKDSNIATTAHLEAHAGTVGEPSPYFNSGVLVIDVDAWRDQGLTEQVLSYAAGRSGPVRFMDQDALNATVPRWQELEPGWNLQLWNVSLAKSRLLTDRQGFARDRAMFRKARVLHFTGPKPWRPTCEARGTLSWVGTFVRSRYLARGEVVLWLTGWLVRRARRRPGISLRRWRARADGLRRVAETIGADRRRA